VYDDVCDYLIESVRHADFNQPLNKSPRQSFIQTKTCITIIFHLTSYSINHDHTKAFLFFPGAYLNERCIIVQGCHACQNCIGSILITFPTLLF
jgi:hypothetical protein